MIENESFSFDDIYEQHLDVYQLNEVVSQFGISVEGELDVVFDLERLNSDLASRGRTDLLMANPANISPLRYTKNLELVLSGMNNFPVKFDFGYDARKRGEEITQDDIAILSKIPLINSAEMYINSMMLDLSPLSLVWGNGLDLEAFSRMRTLFPDFTNEVILLISNHGHGRDVDDLIKAPLFVSYEIMSRLVDANDWKCVLSVERGTDSGGLLAS